MNTTGNYLELLPDDVLDQIYKNVSMEMYKEVMKDFSERCHREGKWLQINIWPGGDPFFVKLKGRPSRDDPNMWFSNNFYANQKLRTP